MDDNKDFDGLMQRLIDKNEQLYGVEIRAKYGDETVERSNARLKGFSREQYVGNPS